MRRIWPLGVVIGSGIVTFVLGLKLSSPAASLVSTAVLVATLVAVTWYSLETRVLRLQQQWDTEIRTHPWLKGSDLIVHRNDEGGVLWREIVYLPVKNMGNTPAHDLQVAVQWRVEGQEPSAGEKKIGSIDLAPGDVSHLKLCEIDFNAPGDRATIDAELAYKTFAGGGGRLKMNFYSHEKGWANDPLSPYEFWLSDGRRFPTPIRGEMTPKAVQRGITCLV